MSAPIIQPQDCCSTCTSTSGGGGGQGQQGPPGPQGPPGNPGVAGSPGIDAFTFLTAGFNMPAANIIISIQVANSLWITPGQYIFIANAGIFHVASVPDSTHVVIAWLASYSSINAVAGTPIPQQSQVSPSGIIGPQGPTGSPLPFVIAYTAAANTPPVANPGVAAAIAINTTDGGQFQWYNNAWH